MPNLTYPPITTTTYTTITTTSTTTPHPQFIQPPRNLPQRHRHHSPQPLARHGRIKRRAGRPGRAGGERVAREQHDEGVEGQRRAVQGGGDEGGRVEEVELLG